MTNVTLLFLQQHDKRPQRPPPRPRACATSGGRSELACIPNEKRNPEAGRNFFPLDGITCFIKDRSDDPTVSAQVDNVFLE